MSTRPHVVHVDRKKNFSSQTLPDPELKRLETAFRAVPWWRDRWTDRKFRAAAMQIVRDSGGLALIGPGMSFETPQPFAEFFEPIEIATGLGYNSDQLKTLSGAALTKEERAARIFTWFLRLLGLVLVGGLIVAYFRGLPWKVLTVFGGVVGLVALVLTLVFVLNRFTGRWYLLPSGIAIVRRPARRGNAARVTVLSRADTCLVFRYVSTGKTVMLKIELWTPLGKRLHRPLSEREAMSVLAAWQSPHMPPPDERLQELSW